MIMSEELNKEEERSIRALNRLAKTFPKSLWLFSASGSLCIMKKNNQGERAVKDSGGMDQAFIVDIVSIENDGGDW
jgi:hypothetical protein